MKVMRDGSDDDHPKPTTQDEENLPQKSHIVAVILWELFFLFRGIKKYVVFQSEYLFYYFHIIPINITILPNIQILYAWYYPWGGGRI